MGRVRLLSVSLIALGLVLVALPQQPVGAAGPTTTTLVIHKGGDRTGPEVVDGPAGAVFDFFDGLAGSPPAPAAVPTASCTTTAPTGTCSVDVPGRSGTNEGYWIRERTAPTGFTIPANLDIGVGSATVPTNYNQLFTGNVLNTTTRNFPEASTNNANLTARGSVWADIRNNPDLPGDCGLNIALLIDVSGSITPFLPQVKDAANGFVDALTGTPSQIAVFSFATNANAVLSSTPVPDASSANTVKTAINGLVAGGGTNWDSGLFQIAASPTTYDAVVMLTDGNPTFYGPAAAGPGNTTRFREIENGIFSANAIKVLGTKIVAVGVGDGVMGATENLQAISGPVRGVDFVQTDYAAIGAVFREIALRTCSGTVNVVKQVIPPAGTIADGVPTGGWTYTSADNNVTPVSGVTADGSGAVSFSAVLGPQPTVPVTLTETQQAGYTLVQNGGLNATCTSDGNPVVSTNVGALGFSVGALRNAIVSCTVYNRAPQPPASVLVSKTWNINGTAYLDPRQPAGFQSELSITEQDAPQWGIEYGGYLAGASVTIGETLNQDLLPPGCQSVVSGDAGPHTLVVGLNTFAVTNTVTCTTGLKLLKQAVNPYGTAEPATSWTLSAYPPGSNTPVITGTTGVSGVVQPTTRYALGETAVAGYTQEIAVGAAIVPPSTGSWRCRLRQRDGMLGPEFDGLNGGVTIQLGQNAECTATNTAQAAKLTLTKVVDGGAAAPADWTLTATPPPASGQPTITGHSGEPAVTGKAVNPGLAYTLTETGPGGYEQVGDVVCVLTGTTTSVPAPGGVLTATLAQDITCTFTNKAIPPSPTPPASSSPEPSAPPLPSTGNHIQPLTVIGAGAVIIGLAMLLAVRRRRESAEESTGD